VCELRAVFKKIDLFFNAYLILNGKHVFRITTLWMDGKAFFALCGFAPAALPKAKAERL
jgi:hypothetical protein